MRSWQSKDLAYALSRAQLRNHLAHGAVAAALTVLLLAYGDAVPRWAMSLTAVATVALGKEYGEVMRRLRRGQIVHWWDGVLDAAGWILFWGLTCYVYSLF